MECTRGYHSQTGTIFAAIPRPLCKPKSNKSTLAGVLVVILAIVHAAALIFWLYLLAKSGNLPASQKPLKKFKNFSVTYDFDRVPCSSPQECLSTPSVPSLGPAKRNISVTNLAHEEF